MTRRLPSRYTLLDAAQRGLHVARHSRLAVGRPRGEVFDLDLHAAVIADVRTQLERRGLGLVDWSISGHTWVFGRSRDPVAVVNEHTWKAFGPEMAHRFRRAYGSYLRTFDGFVATHTPCFSLLYEGLDRPTLAIVSTRYEFPLTHSAERWQWLDDRLGAGVEDGWLTLVANNRADAGYLEHYTGLKPTHIPSACTYIGLTYTGRRRPVVISTGDALARSIGERLHHETVPLLSGLGDRYAWADLYDHRALVLIPYNVSIMSLFEHYTACAPTYVPSRSFLKELMVRHPADVLWSLSFCQTRGGPAARQPRGLDLNDVDDAAVVDWYLDRADFYDPEWMPHIRRFDSWEHLDHLLADDDPHEISAEMAAERPERLRRIAALWDDLPWLQTLARQAEEQASGRGHG